MSQVFSQQMFGPGNRLMDAAILDLSNPKATLILPPIASSVPGMVAPSPFTVNPAPIPGHPLITLGLTNVPVGTAWMGPISGVQGPPSFRHIQPSDIPGLGSGFQPINLSLTQISAGTWLGAISITTLGTITTGTWNASVVQPIYGGTGINSYVLGDTLYASAPNVLSKLAGNVTTTRNFLRQVGTGLVSAAPAWDTVVITDLIANAAGWLHNDGIGGLAWSTPPLAVHDILSASHGDTLADAVVLGDVITGNATPKWERLPGNITTTRKFLRQQGTGAISAAPAWDTLLFADLPAIALDDLSDVIIATPLANQVLAFNGIDWVNTASPSSPQAGPGVVFYFDQTAFPTGGLQELSTAPLGGGENIDTATVGAGATALISAHSATSPIGSTQLDPGEWLFDIFAAVTSLTGSSFVVCSVEKRLVGAGTVTISGAGTSRTATVTAGTPFLLADANADMKLSGWLETPTQTFQITGFTSTNVVTVEIPGAYVNEVGVAYANHRWLFNISTPDLTSTSVTEYDVETVQPAFTGIGASDRVSMFVFAYHPTAGTRTISFYHNGTQHYSHVHSPLILQHNQLAGLQGGAANEYYHLTQAQATIATQAATSLVSGYLTFTDWGTFNSKHAGTIAAGEVTLSMMANIANNTILGNISGGTAVPSALSGSNVRTICGLATTDAPQFARLGLGMAPDANIFLSIPGNASNSSVKIGSFEIQSQAINNEWFADNIYFNGTNYIYRANGFGWVVYFRPDGSFALGSAVPGVAGGTATLIYPLSISNIGETDILSPAFIRSSSAVAYFSLIADATNFAPAIDFRDSRDPSYRNGRLSVIRDMATGGDGFKVSLALDNSAETAGTLTDRLTLLRTGELQLTNSIQTGYPSGGTAKAWKLGEADSNAFTHDRRIRVEVDGHTYWLDAEFIS